MPSAPVSKMGNKGRECKDDFGSYQREMYSLEKIPGFIGVIALNQTHSQVELST